jgi:hypothetical protein
MGGDGSWVTKFMSGRAGQDPLVQPASNLATLMIDVDEHDR